MNDQKHSIPVSSSSMKEDVSTASSFEVPSTPLILSKNHSIMALVQHLVGSDFYKFESPEHVNGMNRFFFSIEGVDKTFFNPGLCATKLFEEYKSKHFDPPIPSTIKFQITTEKPMSSVPSESMTQISIDSIFAYYFHRNLSAYALSQNSTSILMNKEKLPSVDILDFFSVPKTFPEEKCDLTLRRLHSILEEKFFQFRKPEQSGTNHVFIRMKSGLFLIFLSYHQKNELETDHLFFSDNVVFYQDQMYSCVSLEYFAETFLTPFCLNLGTNWEITDDDFI